MYQIFLKPVWLVVVFSLFSLAGCDKPQISDAEHVQNAKQYQDAGDLRATLIELKNALQQNPKNSEARLLLGELYIDLGNGAAAEKELERASELDVSGPYMQKLRGEALLLQGRYEDVLKEIEGLAIAKDVDLMVLQAKSFAGTGEVDKAHKIFQEAFALDPDSVELLLGIAELYFQEGAIEKSRSLVERLLSVDPKHVGALILLGKIQERSGERDSALMSFQKAVDLLGDTTLVTRVGMVAKTNLAKSLIAQGKYDAAKQHVEYLLKAAPKHTKPNFMAGLLAFEQKKYQEAREYFLKVLKVSPGHLASTFLLGSVNFYLGNIEQAEQQLSYVVSERPGLIPARMLLANVRLAQAQGSEVLDLLEPMLAKNPNSVRLLAMAGQAALRSGEFEKGRTFFEKAITENPDESGLRGQLAMLYMMEGDEELAIQELEKAVEQGRSPAREQSMLALLYLKKNRLEKALVIAKELAQNYPDSAYSQNLLGVVHEANGDASLARHAFTDALALEPDYSPASLNLARLDILAGRSKEAQRRLDDLLVKNPKNTSAMMVLAQLADAEGDRSQALEWLEKARVVDSKFLPARLLLARYYSLTGELTKAKEIARESFAIDSDNPQVLMNYGQVHMALGEYGNAVGTFEKLVKQRPDEQSLYSLGLAYFRNNDIESARRSLRRALEVKPDNLQVASLLVVLNVKRGDMLSAFGGIKDIKRLFPKSPAGYVLEGDIWVQQKQYAKAASAYALARVRGAGGRVVIKEADALRYAKGSGAAIDVLSGWLADHEDNFVVRYALATSYSSAGMQTKAIGEYRLLIGKAPQYVPALNDLAWLLYERGELQEALHYALKAYEVSPQSGPVLDTLGWIKLQRGDAKSALTLLRQASQKLPAVAEVQYHLAEALAQTGKKTESKELLEQVLSNGSSFPSRNKAERLLNTL